MELDNLVLKYFTNNGEFCDFEEIRKKELERRRKLVKNTADCVKIVSERMRCTHYQALVYLYPPKKGGNND